MKPRRWLLAICIPIVALAFWRHAASAPADTIARPAPAPQHGSETAAFLGAGSCAASACHNNQNSPNLVGAEYTQWAKRDPHAKAYESLFRETAVKIHKNLSGKVPPHEDGRCLKCHVSPSYESPQPAYFKTDGVSCEACHGSAKQWIDLHHLAAWKRRSPAEKQQLGMRDLHSVVSRAQTCVPCHVGARGMEVDHDLLAAGHPRLHFEFAAFHAQMPRHWPDPLDRKAQSDLEAQLWVAGQIATSHALLEQLARRADPKRRLWPEFAEHDCSTCHHALRDNNQRGFSKRKANDLPWGDSFSLVASALKSLDAGGDAKFEGALAKLHATFDSDRPNRRIIADNASIAAARLTPWLNDVDRRKWDAQWLTKLSDQLREPTNLHAGTDAAVNHLLALIALRHARSDAGSANVFNDRLTNLLRSAPWLERSNPYEPAAIRERLRPSNQ